MDTPTALETLKDLLERKSPSYLDNRSARAIQQLVEEHYMLKQDLEDANNKILELMKEVRYKPSSRESAELLAKQKEAAAEPHPPDSKCVVDGYSLIMLVNRAGESFCRCPGCGRLYLPATPDEHPDADDTPLP